MARTQEFKAYSTKTVALAGTAEQLTATEKFVKSFAVQGLPTNTDYVYIGDINGQNFAIAPGKSITINGDNMDNGTSGKIDLSTVYIDVLVNGEGVAYVALEGL